MAFDVLHDATLWGPAFPEPFVRFELERELTRLRLLPKTTGDEGATIKTAWESYRRHLRELQGRGGPIRVRNQVLEPLVERLGYASLEAGGEVETREGREAGGWLLRPSNGGKHLRAWAVEFEEDLDAPARRGAAYRFSHQRVAQRVLLAAGERVGLLTNGVDLRILVSDPARPESWIGISLDSWRRRRGEVPDSYRLLLALGCPAGLDALADLVDKARLQQTRVTRELRSQARQAIELFAQELLDHPANRETLAAALADRERLARQLWHEGLILIYRLLFTLKLESTDDPARSFSFASTSLWRNTFSPAVALAPYARQVLDQNADTGRLLEDGVRSLFAILSNGLQATELNVRPLGGALFGATTTPLVDRLTWGERAVAHLLDRLLWTPKKRGADARERVHYGSLDVEDLGRVYEALLELEPGIAGEPMCRLRRQKLEVVVPQAQGERYRPAATTAQDEDVAEGEPAEDADGDQGEEEDDSPRQKTRVEWIERIAPGRFYLRVGLGRKATGSYYTPHSFVRFLVQETLGPQVAERSPKDDPKPLEILKLKVLDPAMGSGHFLVEACRFLGAALYEAVRTCDEKALEAERQAERARTDAERTTVLEAAQRWRQPVFDLPDPDDELLQYLPSRAPEGEESGLSQRKAEALCRRLIAVHCLYGVDKNPLAVELAKLSLWIESHAEGLPLTFLDHRLIVGDSITGPFFEHLLKYPGSQQPLDDLFSQGLREQFTAALQRALVHVRDLEASIGTTVAEMEAKRAAKERLDRALAPFRIVAAAWAGGVMLGPEGCDDGAYLELTRALSRTGNLPERLDKSERLPRMLAVGLGTERRPATSDDALALLSDAAAVPALPYDLVFADVFHADAVVARDGFDAVIGNPPWDIVTIKTKEWFAGHDFEVLNASTKRRRDEIIRSILSDRELDADFSAYVESFEQRKRAHDALYSFQKVTVEGDLAGRFLDEFRLFMERNASLLVAGGLTGVVVPSAFHANEGATGIRRLYFESMAARFCYSFENRNRLFEIHRSFKFALVVAAKRGVTDDLQCAFYLRNDDWLFHEKREPSPFKYPATLLERAGGPFLTLLELGGAKDCEICEVAFAAQSLGSMWDEEGQTFSTAEINLTLDHSRIVDLADWSIKNGMVSPSNIARSLEQRMLVLVEGRSIWHLDVLFSTDARFGVPLARLLDRPHWFNVARYYRFAYRRIASSTNERTLVCALIPPGVITAESLPAERAPEKRSNASALARVALLSTFTADYLLRLRVGANVSMFMIRLMPVPIMSGFARRFVAHMALRLQAQNSLYADLWSEQLQGAWREQKASYEWPALEGEDVRWAARAAIDGVVAATYGLSRVQYAHVLSMFSHRGYAKAPDLCLAAFDELKAIGLEAFTKKHDPYWDIPLNENLPEPVIDLPMTEPEAGQADLLSVAESEATYPEHVPELLRAAEDPAPYAVQPPGVGRRGGRPRSGSPRRAGK